MFCSNCGKEITNNAKFCANCGAAVRMQQAPTAAPVNQPTISNTAAFQRVADDPAVSQPFVSNPALPEGIYQDENGAYHWIYRMHMLKNPTVPIMFIKVFGGIMGGIVLLMSMIHLVNDNPEYIPDTLLLFLAITGGFILLFLIIWLIMAAARGGYYIIEHMMDENKVVYLSTPEEKKKMRGWATAAFILGMASGDMTTMATGAALAGSERFDSDYTDVKSIQAVRRRDLIKVNNVLQRNTIYAAPHQYDFVYNYIVAHCPNAKIK